MTLDIKLAVRKGQFALDAEFVAPSHGVSALFGPSGCGKTTLLRAVAGLEPQAEGHCQIAGSHWQKPGFCLHTHKRLLGYVFQEPSLLPHLTVQGNLEFGLRRTSVDKQRVRFDESVELLGVEPLLTRSVADLSGGERQRVAIARALLTSPQLLLMDEPLTALDGASKREILPYLERLPGELNIPILYVSHSTDEVARLADHLLLMDSGRIIASGATSELLARIDLPLARSADAEVVIDAHVESQDIEYQLSQLAFAGGQLNVAGLLGGRQRVRLRIQARDVSIALQTPQRTSVLNCLRAQVLALQPLGESQVVVKLAVGDTPLLSHITRKSADDLELKIGMEVYAQVKSVAVLNPICHPEATQWP
ncbi:molybdenum ABC transporter ATP-binding protein [Porticoccus sp. W117]|uniref:molybdenum ABC transporter ATP-binding protein n=1 Tax=Porticoccus sp. W117 TaxID=3054777 RepID=UPI002591DEF3|nr:molybdenum ABC transporter ATP-binding protein [Porticoccus sp. W117]MDM3872193.1 molybdenum ABC transporter ATP-binding protein [Porticoccus sp. W117]